MQGRSKLFQSGVAKVYIQHVVSRSIWAPHPPRKILLEIASEAIFRPQISGSAISLSKQNLVAIRTLCEVVVAA